MTGKTIISKNAIIEKNVVIGDSVTIEDGVYIDSNCVIRDNVKIQKNTYIGPNSVIGELTVDCIKKREFKNNPATTIGCDSIIRSGTIIYGGCKIGDNFSTGHNVTIREHTSIGNNVSIGTLSDIQGYCTIGDYSRLHSNVHVGQDATIGKYVWIFPYVVLTNDPTPPSNNKMGVKIESFAVICTGATILPGITIQGDSLVAAGAVVTKDVTTGDVIGGVPGKKICDITQIKDPVNGNSVYPWRHTFKRGMPWESSNYDDWKNGKS